MSKERIVPGLMLKEIGDEVTARRKVAKSPEDLAKALLFAQVTIEMLGLSGVPEQSPQEINDEEVIYTC